MKHYLLLLYGAAVLFISCNKQTTDASPASDPEVLGHLIATRSTRIIVLDDDTAIVQTEAARAFFYETLGNPTPYRSAGNVTINGQEMTIGTDNTYRKEAASLNLANGCLWYGSMLAQGKSMSISDTSAFPIYNGTIPYKINKLEGLSIYLNSSLFSNTDSVIVYVSDGAGGNVIQLSAPVTADSIYFSPFVLNGLTSTIMHEGSVTIMPYNGVLRTIDNEIFFLTKETKITQSVNIY